ncbi:MAG: hypothetical protein BACD_00181 [Bacteroides rodentium]
MSDINKRKYPPLCGGVFFTTLIPYRGERIPAKRYYEGIKDPKSDIPTLVSLICVVKPSYEKKLPALKSIRTYTSEFKNCRKDIPAGLFLAKPGYIASFNQNMDDHYSILLWRMHSFLEGNIGLYDGNEPKIAEMTQLVRELIEVLENDPQCKDHQFRIGPNGESMTLDSAEIIYFQSFILGIWHYIVTEHPCNKITENLYDTWLSYSDKGENIDHKIKVEIQDVTKPEEGIGLEDIEDDDIAEDHTDTSVNDDPDAKIEHVATDSVEEDPDDTNPPPENPFSQDGKIVQNFANFGSGPQIANNNGIIILGDR